MRFDELATKRHRSKTTLLGEVFKVQSGAGEYRFALQKAKLQSFLDQPHIGSNETRTHNLRRKVTKLIPAQPFGVALPLSYGPVF